MDRNQFTHFKLAIEQLGAAGVGNPNFLLGQDGKYELQYIPFEHVNRDAKLVIVGITPGPTQLTLAYQRAQELLRAGMPDDEIEREVKKTGAFGGPSMRPNLVKILRHFRFDRLLGIDDVESLWGENAHLLHSTSVVPHAAFKDGKMFAGTFKDVMDSPLLAECFLDCFVPSAGEMLTETLFVGLGQCPQAALEACVKEGVLQPEQVLGAFCHPSTSGGSTTRYFLREVRQEDLKPDDPVRSRCDWLDAAYSQMRSATAALLVEQVESPTVSAPIQSFAEPVSASTPSSTGSTRPKSRPARRTATDGDDTSELLSEVQKAGYKLTRETMKIAEFESPSGKVIYLVKTTSTLSNINLMVHPDTDRVLLEQLPEGVAVSPEHRFHSNMTRFPKRFNRGQSETAYGLQLNLDTLGLIPKVLHSLDRAS